MTAVKVTPSPVHGTLRAPPSKSYTHRALVIGHLANRRFRIDRPLDSDDTRATAAAVHALGSEVHRDRDGWRVEPRTSRRVRTARIDCRESGTTLRFAAAIAALKSSPVLLDGSPRLAERPLNELLSALVTLGARCRRVTRAGLPVEVCGPLHSGRLVLDASRSSQFTSALLCTLPTLSGESAVSLRGTIVSRPYVDATVEAVRRHGVRIFRKGRTYRIPGGQTYRGTRFTVPGDASSAAYLWAAAVLGGGSVRVRGIDRRWPQADLAALDLLRLAGGVVVPHSDGATVSAARRCPFEVDLTDAPDLYPLAGVVAASSPGTSLLRGADHIAFKESDRRQETARLARSFGATVVDTVQGLRIRGTRNPRPVRLRVLGDHRLVMSAAVGALGARGPSLVGDPRSVQKSYPGFWQDLAAITGGASVP